MLSRSDVYEQQISTLTTQLQAAEKSTKDLQTSLDDLVQFKKEHENMLLGSFAQVLNEKKLKIRNQQRLLTSASVDSEKGRLFLFPLLFDFVVTTVNSYFSV